MDPAARLGVPPDADAASIRAAFARQLRAVHPDVAGPERVDPAGDIADLLAARDQLLAPPPTPPRRPLARSCSPSVPASSAGYATGYSVADNPDAISSDRDLLPLTDRRRRPAHRPGEAHGEEGGVGSRRYALGSGHGARRARGHARPRRQFVAPPVLRVRRPAQSGGRWLGPGRMRSRARLRTRATERTSV